MTKSQLSTEKEEFKYGSILISTAEFKCTLDNELKQWMNLLTKAVHFKYKREMDFIIAQLNDFDRKLDRPINDLDDIRIIMETQKKIREIEIDLDMKIETVEEGFTLIAKYDFQLTKEDTEKVENLQFNWLQLQSKAMDVQLLLLTVQEHFQRELISNLEIFQGECDKFVNEYHRNGPMQTGLSPRQASDKLQMFQNHFDALWRKHSSYSVGEDLFGLAHTEQPDLNAIKKELNLLQRLYKLYNDVIDSVNSYYNIIWAEINVEEINNELMEFGNRCRKLPKGLKEWPAFHALKKIIDDFNDICPLLELMSNKAMKYRHWQRIQAITKHTLDLARPRTASWFSAPCSPIATTRPSANRFRSGSRISPTPTRSLSGGSWSRTCGSTWRRCLWAVTLPNNCPRRRSASIKSTSPGRRLWREPTRRPAW